MSLLGHYFLFPTTFVRVGDVLRRTPLSRSSQNAPSETTRKALQALVATPDRPPRRSFSPHFGPSYRPDPPAEGCSDTFSYSARYDGLEGRASGLYVAHRRRC